MSSVLAEAVVKIGADLADFEAGMQLVQEEMHKVGGTLKSIGTELTKYVTVPLTIMGGVAVHEFGEAADEATKLRAVVAATGGAAGVSADHIDQMAKSLQDTTRFSDEVTKSASAVLLTFQSVSNQVGKGNDIFDRTVKVSQDLASVMGTDLNDAVRTLGVALESPEDGLMRLRRANIVLSDAQKQQIVDLQKHGHVLEAQRMILDLVEGKFKGVAAAMAATPTGQMAQAWNQIKEALEGVGGVMAPLVVTIAKGVKSIAESFQTLSPTIKTVVVILGGIAAAIGPALVASVKLGQAITAIRAAALVFGTTAGALLATIGLIVAAVVSWVVAGVELAQNWTRISLKLQLLWNDIKTVALKAITFIIDKTFDLVEALYRVMGKLPLVGDHYKQVGADVAKAHQQFLQSSQTALTGLAQQNAQITADLEKDLLSAGDAGVAAGMRIHGAFKPPPPPIWAEDVKKALGELDAALQTNKDLADVLGPSYDKAGADASAYQKAVEAIAATEAPLNAILDGTGRTLASLAQQFQDAQASADTLKIINDAAQQLTDQLQTNADEALLLGHNFDKAGADADAYKSIIDTLTAAHINLDVVIPGLGKTLRELTKNYQDSQAASDANAKAVDSLNQQYALAQQAVDAALTPQQVYQRTMEALQIALANNKINQEGFNAAVAHAKDVLDKATESSDQLKQGIIDLATKAVDSFIDMALSGKQSFSDFVASALKDIAKLILKIELLKLLFGPGGPLSGLTGGKIPGLAAGGFLGAGDFAIVGEQGPELIQAGRQGVTVSPTKPGVTPPTAQAVATTGDVVHTTFVVQANDAQSVQQFFDRNEGLVTKALLRAYQKSRVMRARLGAV